MSNLLGLRTRVFNDTYSTVAPSLESITPPNLINYTHSSKSQLSCFGSKLGVLTAIESPCRALSIPANGIFYLIVVERAVAECLVTRAPKARRPTVGYREP